MLPPNYKSLRNFLIITSSASRADSLHRSAFISPEPDKDTVSSGIILPPHISYPAKVRWRRSRKDSAGNNGDPPLLLHNSGGNGNHFVNFRLVGTKSNRDAMGARIRVLAGGLSQIREIAGGGSYLSQSDLRANFGLGKAVRMDLVEISWPSGQKQAFRDVAADKFYLIREGRNELRFQR